MRRSPRGPSSRLADHSERGIEYSVQCPIHRCTVPITVQARWSLTLFLILTHNDGWQPQAHIPPPPMRCLAQTSRASQGRRNTVGAHPSPSPAAVSPSPLCAAPAHHHPLAAPSPRPPSRSVPVGQGKKKIRTFFPLSSPAPQLCSPTTPRIPPLVAFPLPSSPFSLPPSTAPSHCHPKNRALCTAHHPSCSN